MTAEELAKALRERRKEVQITQQVLSELSGVNTHTISNLESGKGNPTIEVLGKVLDVLGLEIQLHPRKAPGVPTAESASLSSESTEDPSP